MKITLCLAFLVVCATAGPVEEKNWIRENGENGWFLPREDGSLGDWVDLDDGEWMVERREIDESAQISMSPVTFRIYTRENNSKGQVITNNANSIHQSTYKAHNPTRFIIHGWTQSYLSGMNTNIRQAWLSRGDYNVIVVDWARARSVEYASSVAAVSSVGKKVANMIDYLVWNHGLNLDELIVIGHSLGAHVSGYAGKNTKSGKIGTIVGLDPALPLFNYKKPHKRLSNTDANYVETIQTDGGGLGFLKPIGKASFYPNGGKSQPGCPLDITGACSHGRSCTYYAEGVERNDFPTMKCGNYQDAVKQNCGSTYSSVRMANSNNMWSANGDYYVPVNKKAPYGMG